MTSGVKTFFDMGGYGFYIWLAYGASLIALLGLTLIIHRRFARAKTKLDAASRD